MMFPVVKISETLISSEGLAAWKSVSLGGICVCVCVCVCACVRVCGIWGEIGMAHGLRL